MGGVEKRNGTTPGPGFRVWKIRVNRVNKDRLKVLYNDVIHKRNRKIPKDLLYYAEEWDEMFENSKRQREEAGKRTLPKTPPLLLLVKFIMPDGRGGTRLRQRLLISVEASCGYRATGSCKGCPAASLER
jgi:hypothetical protein